MFQLDWYNYKNANKESLIFDSKPNLFDKSNISSIQFSFWAEHCIECSAPKCYKTCEIFEKRFDHRCKRTEYGLEKIEQELAILNFGVNLKFRKWGKLETYIYDNHLNLKDYLGVCNNYLRYQKIFRKKGLFNPLGLANNYCYWKITRNHKTRTTSYQNSDYFIFEFYSYNEKEFLFFIEGADAENKSISRISIKAQKGFNSYKLNYSDIAPEGTNVVRIFPEEGVNPEITIFNAEFVKLKLKPSEKAKCVVWDLDNTIWDGILAETNDPDKLKIRDGVIDVIKALDEKGIVQSICSKNDYQSAVDVLKKMGIFDYFVFPEINWNPKSLNIRNIAKNLNINLDTFVLVDDSFFEREEVKSVLPQVRVYDEKTDFLKNDEFDLVVTEEAKNRRLMYKQEEKRKNVLNDFGNDYLSFLKNCCINVDIKEISKNTSKDDIKRCFELVNRTNQLNISGRRYNENEFDACLLQKKHIYFSCNDKYGSYGIVGYVCFEIKEKICHVDEFALSCRVAKKHIEESVFKWMLDKFFCEEMHVHYIKTQKNGPIRESLIESGFMCTREILSIEKSNFSKENIVKINEK